MFAELGARLVIAQHSHVVGPIERVAEGWVIYGQGNLVFDWLPEPGAAWEEGILVSLNLGGDKPVEELIPFHQVMPPPGLRCPTTVEIEGLLTRFSEWGRILQDEKQLGRFWNSRSQQLGQNLLLQLLFRSRGARRVSGRMGVLDVLLGGRRRRFLLNLVRCEAHREVLEMALKERQGSSRP